VGLSDGSRSLVLWSLIGDRTLYICREDPALPDQNAEQQAGLEVSYTDREAARFHLQ